MSQRPLHSAAELLRLIHNLVRLGTIAQVDHAQARVRVTLGEITTGWLPWIESRAGTTRTWCPPTVGEQCAVLAPGGDTVSAVVITGLYRATHPAPSDSADKFHAAMPDGAVIEYDHAASHLQATLPGSATLDAQGDITATTPATLTATAGGGATLNADTVINGTLAINGGSVTHNGTDIGDSHRHPQGPDSDNNSQQNTGAPL